MRQISMTTRDELVAAIAGRYAWSGRSEKGRILDEFVAVTKMHRKHAQRLLRQAQPRQRSAPRPGRRIYDEAVREALILLWEEPDRICGKRLVNFAHNANGTFAYVTIGGINEVKVFRTDTFEQVATIPVGNLPHGVWPSGDGTRVYVGLEADDQMTAIDTLTNKVIASVPIGQAPQAIAYVPNAVPDGAGTDNLMPLGLAGQAAHLTLAAPGTKAVQSAPPTS